MLRMQSGGNNLPTAYEYYACYASRVETVVYRIRASVHVGVARKGSPSLTFSTTSNVHNRLYARVTQRA